MELLTFIEYSFTSAYWKSLDFLYVSAQNLWAYDFKSKLVRILDFLRENEYIYFSELLEYWLNGFTIFELFVANFYDFYIKDTWIAINANDEILYDYLSNLDYSLRLVYNPELVFVREIESDNLLLRIPVEFRSFLYNNVTTYSLDIPFNIMLQLFALFFFTVLFVSFFLSFFNSSHKEEWAADTDYAVSNLTVECEKEIFSIDDALYLIMTFIFFFGTYFGYIAFGLGFNLNDASFFFWALPIFAVSLLFVPLNLLYDFGLLFPLYLRGSSTTASCLTELMYDLISIVAFFTRLVVQFVRIILIIVVYCMMHDAVILQEMRPSFLPINESFLDDVLNIRFNPFSISYFFFYVLPVHLLHWAYEVFHTFFVVTGQFAAFFVIAIWLFCLFYTFFAYEQYENHFHEVRKERAKKNAKQNLLLNKSK